LPMVSSASSISGPTIASTSSFHGPGQPRASNSSAPPLESLSRFTPLTVNQAYSQRGAKAPLTIVESLAGNENLEVQWRLATLRGDAVPQIPLRPLAHQNCIRRDPIVAPTRNDYS